MEAIVQERKLLRLRLSLTQRPEPDSLLCEVLRGDEPLLEPWAVPLADFNVVPYRGDSQVSGRQIRTILGDYASHSTPAAAFTSALQGLGNQLDPEEVLWLELARPKGLLPQLPWEAWIQGFFHQRVLRLPRFALKPVRPKGRLDLAWCSSSPQAKGEIPVTEHLGQTWEALDRAGVEARLHVFVDAALRDQIAPAFPREMVDTGRLKVYTTPTDDDEHQGAGKISDAYDTRRSPLRNTWLRWMTASLPQGVDLVHFTHHGYLSKGRGALAFSRSPELNDDPHWARFVYADELRVFLDQLGAVGLGVTSPVGNFSIAGLRSLADEIVDRRPGPVVFHDSREDSDGSALADALAFLYGEGASPPPSPAVAVYCHPDRLRPEISDQELLELVELEVKELLTEYEAPSDGTADWEDMALGQSGGSGGDEGELAEEGAEEMAEGPEEFGVDSEDVSTGRGGGFGLDGDSASTPDDGDLDLEWDPPVESAPAEEATGGASVPPSKAGGGGEDAYLLDWTQLYRGNAMTTDQPPADAVKHVMMSRYTLAKKIRPERYEQIITPSTYPTRGGAGDIQAGGDEGDATPKAWVRSSQRVLERHLAQLGSKALAETRRGRAAQKGAADGLQFVAELLSGKRGRK